MSVVENIQNVRAKIAAAAEKSGRMAEDVLLLAVSKTKPVELIGEAVQQGITVVVSAGNGDEAGNPEDTAGVMPAALTINT